MDDEYIETNCRTDVLTLYIHRLYIGGSRSFSNKQGIHVFECYYFSNGYFYELANLYVFKYQTQKFIDISMCTQKLGDIYVYVFCVFWSETLCAHLYMYVPPIRAGMSIRVWTLMYCLQCLKLCSMKFWLC